MLQHALMWLSRLGVLGLTGLAVFLALDPDTRLLVNLISREPDKAAHVLITAALTLTGLLAFPGLKARWIFLVMITLSIGVEVAQFFIGRSAHVFDFISSLLGIALVGLAFSSAWLRKDRVQS